jgi:hypothetical protein
MAPDEAAPDEAAPDEAAPEVIGADEAAPVETAPDGTALDVIGALAAAVEPLLEVELLDAALLSLPQALTVRAPAASKATSPVIRVIFTQILRVSSSWNPRPTRPGTPQPRRILDGRGGGLTTGQA